MGKEDYSWVHEVIGGGFELAWVYLGIETGLFNVIRKDYAVSPSNLAEETHLDQEYLTRWCETGTAFDLLHVEKGKYKLSSKIDWLIGSGRDLLPLVKICYAFVSSAYILRDLMKSGEQLGFLKIEDLSPFLCEVLGGSQNEDYEKEVFVNVIFPKVEKLGVLAKKGARVLDIGCGNGWFLRALAKKFKALRGIGFDALPQNIKEAKAYARREGLLDRLSFRVGDMVNEDIGEGFDFIVFNQALRFAWHHRRDLLKKVHDSLVRGGQVLVWEHNCPKDTFKSHDPKYHVFHFGNLINLIVGARLLGQDDIENTLHEAGFKTERHLVHEGTGIMVFGKK